MNKVKNKANLSLVSGKPKTKAVDQKQLLEKPQNVVSAEEAALEQLASEEFWKAEIDALRSEKFDSIQQAIDKVISQVILKMNFEIEDEQDTKEFLRLVFESSETLQESLRATLKIS